MPPRFIFFDLGKVLVDFDIALLCRQVGEVAGLESGLVKEVLFDGRLQHDYESGRISTRQFYESFCQHTHARPDYEPLLKAASDIFWPNTSVLPLVRRLRAAGRRLGILSNTCEAHWEHCLRRFPFLGEWFDVHVLSFRIGAMKPDAAIFQAAAVAAGHAPQEIFFTDDIPGHVAGARAVGFDAAQYTSAAQLAAELRQRGVPCDD